MKIASCMLKLEAVSSTLKARSSNNVEIIRHKVWGCFRISPTRRLSLTQNKQCLWETTMESYIQDYKTISGVNVAHSGRTSVCLIRIGENSDSHTRTRMEEIQSVDEVDYNVKELSTNCFWPPGNLKQEGEGFGMVITGDVMENRGLPYKILDNYSRICAAKSGIKILAIDEDNLELFGADEVL